MATMEYKITCGTVPALRHTLPTLKRCSAVHRRSHASPAHSVASRYSKSTSNVDATFSFIVRSLDVLVINGPVETRNLWNDTPQVKFAFACLQRHLNLNHMTRLAATRLHQCVSRLRILGSGTCACQDQSSEFHDSTWPNVVDRRPSCAKSDNIPSNFSRSGCTPALTHTCSNRHVKCCTRTRPASLMLSVPQNMNQCCSCCSMQNRDQTSFVD